MSSDNNNGMRSVIAQLTGGMTDQAFSALVSAYNLPAGLTLAVAQAVAKGALQGVMLNCYDDVKERQLSMKEVAKHNYVFEVAERTYFEMVTKDTDACTTQLKIVDDTYFQHVFETAEHVSMEAIHQSETKKIEVLGRYYGGEFYKNGWNLNFMDMHQIITMVGALTFRQIVLIRLISEGLKGYDTNLFVNNPTACVEINRLKDYGIWQTEGAAFGINDSWVIQLKSVIPTIYSEKVCEALLLDKISDDDVNRIMDSLELTEEGKSVEILTKEDYDKHTKWQDYNDEGHDIITNGGLDLQAAIGATLKNMVKNHKE